MADPVTKKLFCAACQVDTEHAFQVVKNPHGHVELIGQCKTDKCGRMIKFPQMSGEELAASFRLHKNHNIGQVPAGSDAIPDDHPLLKALAEL